MMQTLQERIPKNWQEPLSAVTASESFGALAEFLRVARTTTDVFPPEEETFAALQRTPLAQVRVVLLGQDPYHGEGEANGLSFSIARHVKIPSSLRNIFKELKADLDIDPAPHGDLSTWSDQGVLLLNTVLSVEKDSARSHRKKGWEPFTDAVLEAVNNKSQRVVFILLGNDAKKKIPLIDTTKHVIVDAVHPSGLSAHRGFFGSKIFSKTNQALVDAGLSPINWSTHP